MPACFRGSEWRKWDLHIHSNASDGHSSPSDIIEMAKENAIAHKFYGSLTPIQISIYADKIYIANDCIPK